MTKRIRFKVIATILGILLIWVISGSSGIKDVSVTLLAVGLMVILSGFVPFIIGIISQALFKRRKLSSRAAIILAAISVAALICINGKPPITFYENFVLFVLGTLLSLAIFYVFIDAGIKTCNAYRKGRAKHNERLHRIADRPR